MRLRMVTPVFDSIKASYNGPEAIGLLLICKQIALECKPILEACPKRLYASIRKIEPEILFKALFDSNVRLDSAPRPLSAHLSFINSITMEISDLGRVRAILGGQDWALLGVFCDLKALRGLVKQDAEMDDLKFRWTETTYAADPEPYAEKIRTITFTREKCVGVE